MTTGNEKRKHNMNNKEMFRIVNGKMQTVECTFEEALAKVRKETEMVNRYR